MSDRFRTTLAFLLIIGILVFWSLMSKPKTVPDKISPGEKSDTLLTGQKTAEEPLSPVMPAAFDTVVIDKENYRLVLCSAGGSVKEFYLKEYNVDIIPQGQYLFITQLNPEEILDFDMEVADDSVVFAYGDEKSLKKVYRFNEPYGFQLTVSVPETLKQQILDLKAGMRITEEKNANEDLRHFNIYLKNKKVEQLKKKVKDKFTYTGDVDWLGLRSKYFLLVINNLAKIESINFYKLPKYQPPGEGNAGLSNGEFHRSAFGCYFMRGGGDRYGAEIITSGNIDVSVLLLPIKYSKLAAFKKGYEAVSSGGLLGPISRLFLGIFNLLYSLFKNYGLAIIIFAILIKLIFFPLSRQMIKSQHKMQLIQPELKKLQKKYKDDPQRLNQEMMHLYKTYKVNPFSGCLPLLIQMPIFIALYQTLISSIEFRQAPFIFWITDLSFKDPYYVLPIAMGVMMLVQSLLTTIDPRQRFMVVVMPLFMVFIFLNFPSGLQLYWFSYNILTLVEHIIIKRGGIK